MTCTIYLISLKLGSELVASPLASNNDTAHQVSMNHQHKLIELFNLAT